MKQVNIIETKLNFTGEIRKRPFTKGIVLHHRAGSGDVLSLHEDHLKKGWLGMGYHFYIRRDGKIYRGRPIDTVGAHAEGHNSYTVGICFEGNFENDKMGKEQLEAGKQLIKYIEKLYGSLACYRHSDLSATACPGKNFPYEEILRVSSDDVVERMFVDGVTSLENVKNWETFLASDYCPSKYVREIFKRYQERVRK